MHPLRRQARWERHFVQIHDLQQLLVAESTADETQAVGLLVLVLAERDCCRWGSWEI